ncbi:MAG: hypothetical protein J2P26_07190, partial [Nocardiopsaceae bacterium]|nr:hypothetical protein [Nocardiopsaceae bacterium]
MPRARSRASTATRSRCGRSAARRPARRAPQQDAGRPRHRARYVRHQDPLWGLAARVAGGVALAAGTIFRAHRGGG